MEKECNECFGLKITPLNSFEQPWTEWMEDNNWDLSDHLKYNGSISVSTGVESNNLEAIRIHYKDSANKAIVENYLRSLGDLYNKLVVIDSEVRKLILLVYRCNEVIIPRTDDLFLWGNMDGMKLYAYHIGEGNSFIFNTYQFEVRAGRIFDPVSKTFEISNITEEERNILWTNAGKLDQYQT